MIRSCARFASRISLLLLPLLLLSSHVSAYSVLTHEELIDLAWNDSIRPFLLARFPGATEHQLVVAHAYAYGGSAIQDMGYYPFGKRYFSNLTHYARSGDFVAWMFRNAGTINELAFAIGALSHYIGDSIGHSEAINPATATEFPKLKRKFGENVTYGENPHAHIRTEFAFDIDELTDAAFAPPEYLRTVGFRVPQRFLEAAFAHTYGFEIHDLVGRTRPDLRSYRFAVRSFIALIAEAEVVLHRHHFPPHPDDDAYRLFARRVARTNYERKWKHRPRGRGIKAHLLAAVIFVTPKIGALSDLKVKIPNQTTEDWYLRSVNHTVDAFRKKLQEMAADPASGTLANLDLDTGHSSKFGDYPLADRTYAWLVKRLTAKPQLTIAEDLQRNIKNYYSGVQITENSQRGLQKKLDILEAMKATTALR